LDTVRIPVRRDKQTLAFGDHRDDFPLLRYRYLRYYRESVFEDVPDRGRELVEIAHL
jgi:hypothetical protein